MPSVCPFSSLSSLCLLWRNGSKNTGAGWGGSTCFRCINKCILDPHARHIHVHSHILRKVLTVSDGVCRLNQYQMLYTLFIYLLIYVLYLTVQQPRSKDNACDLGSVSYNKFGLTASSLCQSMWWIMEMLIQCVHTGREIDKGNSMILKIILGYCITLNSKRMQRYTESNSNSSG